MFNDLATFIARLGIDWQSWKGFIEETFLSVAFLSFGFLLLLSLSVTLLVWRRGAPWTRAELFEYVFLSAFGSIYVAVFFSALLALLWPAMTVIGVSNQVQEAVVSVVEFDYINASVVAVFMLFIVFLLIGDNKKSKPRLGRIIAKALDIWWVEAWYETEKQNRFWRIVTDPDTTREQIEQMERDAADKGKVLLSWLARKALRERFGGGDAGPQTEGSNLQPASTEPDPPQHRSRVSKGFHRLGIVVGAVLGLGLAALVVLQGEVAWGIGIGVVLFLVAYGFFRMLGWIVDGFFSGAR